MKKLCILLMMLVWAVPELINLALTGEPTELGTDLWIDLNQ